MGFENFTATIKGVFYTFDELKKLAAGTDPEILEAVAFCGNNTLCYIVATNSRATPKLLTMLASYNQHVATGVARNKSAPPEAWYKLSTHKNASIRLAVAASKHASPEVLEKMAAVETDKRVLVKLAGNQNTGYTAVRILATSGDPVKQKLVAANPKLDVEVLISLMLNVQVLTHAVGNPNSPLFVLEYLAEHLNGAKQNMLRSSAVYMLAQREEYWDWPSEWIEAQYDVVIPGYITRSINTRKDARNKLMIAAENTVAV